MRAKHRFLSVLLSGLLVTSYLPCLAYADLKDGSGQRTTEAETSDKGTDAGTGAESGVGNAAAVELYSVETPIESEPAVGNVSVIQYVCIESLALEIGSDKNVVVGFADESFIAVDALLTIRDAGWQEFILECTGAIQGAVLFGFPGAQVGEGSFSAVSLTLVDSDGQKEVVSLTGDEVNSYSFEVAKPDKVEGEASQDVFSAYTIDDEGGLMEASSIEEVIDAAAESAAPSLFAGSARNAANLRSSTLVVVLDLGHGGADGGASANGIV